METTLGARIALLRKQNGWKQDELAEKMGVSPQAVSKWENDQACPDITLLPKLAKLLNISVDELLSGKEEKEEETTMVLPEEQRKDISKMLFRIVVDSADGDRVRVNLPLGIIKLVVDSGTQLEIMKNEKLADIDFKSLLEMVEQGVVGELISVDTAAGDKVRIYVE